MRRTLVLVIAAVVAGLGVGNPAQSESVEEFYRGKTIELIVPFGAGGGYDRYARLLAAHMGRHIPGNPVIVPKNMPGGGGLVATNHLYSVAPRDGTVFGTLERGIAVMPLLAPDDVIEFEPRGFNWIGSLNTEVSTCVSWHTSPVKTWDDLLETELLIGGTAGARSEGNAFARVLRSVFGARLSLITGYSGSNEVLLAMERGEVEGICPWSWSSAKSRRPEWIRDGQVNILVQLALEKHPELPDVPLVMDLAETDEQRQMLTLLLSRLAMGRPFAAPPGVPEERVRALRNAFDATVRDPEFLAEAELVKLEINSISGEQIDELLRSVYETPEDVVAMAREASQG